MRPDMDTHRGLDPQPQTYTQTLAWGAASQVGHLARTHPRGYSSTLL